MRHATATIQDMVEYVLQHAKANHLNPSDFKDG